VTTCKSRSAEAAQGETLMSNPSDRRRRQLQVHSSSLILDNDTVSPTTPSPAKEQPTMDEPNQTDISALPIDKQMEHILRSRLDIQELVSLPPCSCHIHLTTAHQRPLTFVYASNPPQKITDISANCGNSFSIVVVSKDFEKKGTLARHRLSTLLLIPPSLGA
jgi:stress-induced morphogen